MRARRHGTARDHLPPPRQPLRGELDVDGRLSAYSQAQRHASAHGVHLRGREALQRFQGLQDSARTAFAATPAKDLRRRRRVLVEVLLLLVLAALAAAAALLLL